MRMVNRPGFCSSTNREYRQDHKQQSHHKAAQRRGTDDPGRFFPARQQRDGKHDQVSQPIADEPGVEQKLVRFLVSSSYVCNGGERQGGDRGKDHGAYGRAVARVEAAEPLGEKMVPAGDHRKPAEDAEGKAAACQ